MHFSPVILSGGSANRLSFNQQLQQAITFLQMSNARYLLQAFIESHADENAVFVSPRNCAIPASGAGACPAGSLVVQRKTGDRHQRVCPRFRAAAFALCAIMAQQIAAAGHGHARTWRWPKYSLNRLPPSGWLEAPLDGTSPCVRGASMDKVETHA